MSQCAVEGCERRAKSHSYCEMHYRRWRNHGDPEMRRPTRDPEVRFAEKVATGDPPHSRPGLGACQEWMGTVGTNGYGYFSVKHAYFLAHRWAYEHYVGTIPAGLVVDHLCRNRRCVNIDHLEAVTNLENLRRGAGYGLRNGMRKACINGHPYTPQNTYIDPTRGGVRCRECARERDRKPERSTTARKLRKKEAL